MTRPRLLPFTIAALGVVLALKVSDVARDVTRSLPRGAIVTAARAAGETPPAAASPVASNAGQNATAAPATVQPGAAGSVVASASGSSEAAADTPTPDPVDAAERKILLELRQRREAIDGHEQALASREGMLGAAEKRLSMRVEELQALQEKLEALETARRAREAANWQGLVATYEKMKPRDAAPIFNEMDLSVLLPILDRMKDSKTSAVLAAMNPDRARLVTQKLAETRLAANAPDTGTQKP